MAGRAGGAREARRFAHQGYDVSGTNPISRTLQRVDAIGFGNAVAQAKGHGNPHESEEGKVRLESMDGTP